MEPIRIGVIGNGIIGHMHLRNYRLIPQARVVALCDIDPQVLAQTGDEFDIPEKDRTTQIGDLLKRDDIQAVDVCLHNNLHAPVAIAALEAGKDLYHLRSYGWRRRGRPYVDGYATKEFVNKTTSGGGALFDMGVYHIAQLLYLAGLPALERVVGATYARVAMNEGRRQLSGFNVEELGCGFATYENGLTLDVLESWAVHMGPFPGSMLLGGLGGIRLAPLRFFFTQDDLELEAEIDIKALDYRNHTVFCEQPVYDSSQGHWIAALSGQCPLLPTARIALQTQLLQEGIYQSQQQGRELTAGEIRELSVSNRLTLTNL